MYAIILSKPSLTPPTSSKCLLFDYRIFVVKECTQSLTIGALKHLTVNILYLNYSLTSSFYSPPYVVYDLSFVWTLKKIKKYIRFI